MPAAASEDGDGGRRRDAHPMLEEEAGSAAMFDDGFPCMLAKWPSRPDVLCLTDSRVVILKTTTTAATTKDRGNKDADANAGDGRPARKLSTVDAKLGKIGEQKTAAFAADGGTLALGAVDGILRVVACDDNNMKMKSSIKVTGEAAVGSQAGATPDKQKQGALDTKGAITCISLAADGSRALVVCESGMLTLWDLEAGTMLSGLPSRSLSTDTKRSRGRFRAAAFVPNTHGHAVVISFNDPNGGHLYKYLLPFFGNIDTPNGDKRKQTVQRDKQLEWTKICSVRAHIDPITAMAVSGSGQLVATGTSEGDVAVFSAGDFAAVTTVKNAHMVFVTGLDWKPHVNSAPTTPSRGSGDQEAAPVEVLLSVSADSAALVTVVDPNSKSRFMATFVKLVIFLLLLALIFIAYCIYVVSEEVSRVGL